MIKQLSIFLENRQGRLTEVAEILGNAGINMTAFSVADNSDFGILRLIVSDPTRAHQLLKEKLFAVSLTDVICVDIPNAPGSLAAVLQILSAKDVFIEYMYAFSLGETACAVIRPNQPDVAVEALKGNNISLIKAEALYK
jgi:hypothetical protein